MRLLLDSHVFLWAMAGDRRLPAAVARQIRDADEVRISAATAWELGIKASLGKLTLGGSVSEGIRAAGFLELPVSIAHAEAAAALPMHHRDPFDRMLVAQARSEGLTLVTGDAALSQYEVTLLRVP